MGSGGIILFRQWTTKALIRLRGCAGWSVPLLFAYCIKNHGPISVTLLLVGFLVWYNSQIYSRKIIYKRFIRLFQCSVSCDKGTMSRTVECQSAAGQLLDDVKCDAAVRPYDTQPCNSSPCPTTTLKITTEIPPSTTQLSLSWTMGSWTQVSRPFDMSHVMGKPVYAICKQQKHRSTCASSQSDPVLCYWLPR